MPRPRQRACLESGLKIDLNWLIRRRIIVPGCRFERPRQLSWSKDDEEVASAEIMFDLQGQDHGYIDIKIGSLTQHIHLVARPRHFGGRQWFFVCPYLHRRCMVLWMPPEARDFGCRQRWGRSVAYNSQFLHRDDRAHRGKAKISSRLCSIGGLDRDEWEFPPKPKWMRWKTYHRAEEKFDRYESILDQGSIALAAKLVGIM